jgi:integrase/recombinase XerD
MASLNLFLDKNRTNKNKRHPVCIRICHMRKQWMVSLKVYAIIKEYEKAVNGKGSLTQELKDLRALLLEKRQKAQYVLDSLNVTTKDSFNQAYYSEVDLVRIKDMLDIKSQFSFYIEELKEQERIRTAVFYKEALDTFLDYKKNIALQDIDEAYLSRYEAYMKATGRSKATAFMYMRALRSIFNRAIKRKILNPKYYPFREYSIPAARKSKSVLYPNQVEKFFNYTPLKEAGQRAKDYWFFSFLAKGMNPKDMMSLRYKNLKGDKLIFQRAKTSRTKQEAEEIVLFLHPHAMNIIKKWGNTNKPDNYIFPLFNDCKDEQERYAVLKEWKRQTNMILGGWQSTWDLKN